MELIMMMTAAVIFTALAIAVAVLMRSQWQWALLTFYFIFFCVFCVWMCNTNNNNNNNKETTKAISAVAMYIHIQMYLADKWMKLQTTAKENPLLSSHAEWLNEWMNECECGKELCDYLGIACVQHQNGNCVSSSDDLSFECVVINSRLAIETGV